MGLAATVDPSGTRLFRVKVARMSTSALCVVVTELGCAAWHRVIFLMQFAHLINCLSHCMAQEPPNVSVCALHSIFMPSTMCV